MRWALLCVTVGALAVAAWAVGETLSVQMDRPMKAGQQFHLVAKFEQVEGGAVAGSRNGTTVSVLLGAYVSVEAVDAQGGIAKATYRLSEFKAARDYIGRRPAGSLPPAKYSLPKDTFLEVSANRNGVTIKSDGQVPVLPEMMDYLKLVILLNGGENLGYDVAFGTADKQKVGGSWAVSADPIAKILKGVKVFAPGAIKGRTTLKAATEGADGKMTLRSEVTFGTKGQMLMETRVPTDAARLPLDRLLATQVITEGRAADGSVARGQSRVSLSFTFKEP